MAKKGQKKDGEKRPDSGGEKASESSRPEPLTRSWLVA
jgi:hypothetical protein